jgi:hypothetical protein
MIQKETLLQTPSKSKWGFDGMNSTISMQVPFQLRVRSATYLLVAVFRKWFAHCNKIC